MGAFYTNLTVNTTHRDAVVAHCTTAQRTAFVSKVEHSSCVVFDEQSDEDPEGFAEWAADLSARCQCAALLVTNHDDDVLLYTLYRNGDLLNEYISSPEFVADFGEEAERGGDSRIIADAFAVPDRRRDLERLLSAPVDEIEFESVRHAQIVELLSLPRCAVGTGFAELADGTWPEGYGEADFALISA